jgi:hypothetical protein
MSVLLSVSVDEGVVLREWDETAFRWDIHSVTLGSHIEHL